AVRNSSSLPLSWNVTRPRPGSSNHDRNESGHVSARSSFCKESQYIQPPHAHERRDDAVSQPEPLIRNISDTAICAALYRASETERRNELFRDPFARQLASDRGEQIATAIKFTNVHS